MTELSFNTIQNKYIVTRIDNGIKRIQYYEFLEQAIAVFLTLHHFNSSFKL